MKANRAYELVVRRGGRGPALLSGPGRIDTLEIVEIDTGEVALFWELSAGDAGRMARALRADLAGLDAREFMAKWRAHG